MSPCSLCGGGDDCAVCDRCGSTLCYACSGLTSTEIRAITLKKRKISYYCDGCQSGQSSSGALSAMLEEMRNALLISFKQSQDKLRSEFQEMFERLHGEMLVIKETNIDMIKLLSPSSFSKGSGSYGERAPLKSCVGTTSVTEDCAMDGDVSSLNHGRSENIGDSSVKRGAINRPSMAVPGPVSAAGVVGGVKRTHANLQKPIIGTRKECDGICAAVIPRRSSICVSRLSLNVTERNLKEYVAAILGDDHHGEIFVEKQTVKSGAYNCYRVETDASTVETLLLPSSWPENIMVKKFRFFRRQNTELPK